MSAAALRRPPSAGAVARHYLGLLARERGVSAFLLPFSVMLLGSMNADGFGGLGLLLSLAFFYPLYQWRGGGRDTLDPAMPVDAALHRRIRVACGAAWAALGLAACVGLYTGLFAAAMHGLGGYPVWYPATLLGWGVAAYLFGSAAWLRAERPGRVLTLAWFAALTVMGWLPRPVRLGLLGMASPAELRVLPGAAWVGACVLALALGWAAQWISASAEPQLRGVFRRKRDAGRREAPAAAAPARTISAPAGPRRPATAARVLRRELAIVSHDARWALLVALLLAVQVLRPAADLPASAAAARLPLHGRAEALLILSVVAFFWPLLVWMDDRGAGREWAEAVPAGMIKRRLLRLLAGAAWMELVTLVVGAGVVAGAWRAGVIASAADVPAAVWAGVPIGVLMMYLIGSIPLLLSRSHPVRYTVAWYFVFLIIASPLIFSKEWRLSPGAALSVVSLTPPRHWAEAVLIWLPLLIAVAVSAVAGGVAHDRSGAAVDPA